MRLFATCMIAVLAALVTPVNASAHAELRRHIRHRPDCQSAACDHRVDVQWGRTHHPPHMNPAVASWFEDDVGATACSAGHGATMHVEYGYAHLPEAGWSCGTRVRFCYEARCVTGVREDSGPYIKGRTFDLTPSLKSALACPDVCHLHWRRL